MNNDQQIKETVKEKYSAAAEQSRNQNASSCCGATGCGPELYNIMADDYAGLEGYNPDADLGLGCGIPTAFANIKQGDTVIDLGSGAGNDAFIAASKTGAEGRVIGVDFTEAMIVKATANAGKLGLAHVDFRLGDIESLPVTANIANVVLSNCVLNLVPNKHKAFSEIFRVLKPGGHFSISDIVLGAPLPEKAKKAAELYAGCVSGALVKKEYLDIIAEAGFEGIQVLSEKRINIPDEILSAYLDPEEIESIKADQAGIYSITVTATKPAKDDRNCCEPGSGCC